MILALVGGAHDELGRRLVAALSDAWVATYAVSFGPPLVGASPRLKERLAEARGAFDKVQIYCDTLLVPPRERSRMYWRHRARLRSDDRAEITRRSVEAIDLTMRLHHPESAPAPVIAAMEAAGVELAAVPSPAQLEGRLFVRVDDPMGKDLGAQLQVDEAELVLELVIDPAADALWRVWAARLADTRLSAPS